MIDTRCSNRTSWQLTIKYAADRVAAVVSLMFLAPLFLLVAAAIKLCDGGPVFFMQERHGWGGKLFRIYKFRSMIVDADRFLDDQGRVTVANRVTAVGRILRLTSIDELPQLINIARGEMSLIGPRPLPTLHYHKLTPSQQRRFRMRPGLTGLAQIHGRNRLKWSKRLAYDVQYVDHYTLCRDLAILVKTFRVLVSGEGIVLDRNPEHADDLGPGATPAAKPRKGA